MADFVVQALQSTKDQSEKAAIIAEATFALLPAWTARAARSCIILHWFNQSTIQILLEDSELTLDEMEQVYEQLATLPFIDTVPWGLTFQDTTREGLLKRYSIAEPELLQSAARLAVVAYEMREEDRKSMAEAFFCSIVAGDQESGIALRDILFEEAGSQQNWQFLDNLLHLQAEAEALPFVQPLPRSAQQYLLQGLLHRIQDKRDAALLDYQQALALNPSDILSYMSRGITYTELGQYNEALVDYNTVLKLDKNFASAYLGRSIIYTKQGKHKEAFRENERAMRLGLNTEAVFINRGNILNEFGQYEDALVACDEALQLNQNASEAYIGKGQAFTGLERYADALTVYEQAPLIDPNSPNAYIGKGQALNGLQRYVEALVACNIAIQLNPRLADAYRTQAHALRNLKRYVEATEASRKANELDPMDQEDAIEDIIGDKDTRTSRQGQREVGNRSGIVSFLDGVTSVFRPSQRRVHQKAPPKRSFAILNTVGNTLAAAFAIIIILASISLFASLRIASRQNGIPVNATGTAQAKNATATRQVLATQTGIANTQATATATIISGNPNPYPPNKGTLALYDPLKNNTAGYRWDEGNGCTFTGGSYHVTESTTGKFTYCVAGSSNFTNFAYYVEMTIVSGDCGGMVFRADSSNNNFYDYEVCQDGSFYLASYTTGNGKYLIQPTNNGAILKGMNQDNLIAVVAQGGSMTLYINNHNVGNFTNRSFVSGQVGVLADAVNSSTDVSYAFAKVWTL